MKHKVKTILFIGLALIAIFGMTACPNNAGGSGGGGKPTPKKHAITFSIEGANGTLKAKADGIAETNISPINVEQGKTVTFTATPDANHKVKGWMLDGNTIAEAGTNTEYKLTVTKACTVKVSFEAITSTNYTVTLTQTGGGKVTASPAIPADGQVAKDTEITFTATANAGYRVGTWSVTPSEAIQSGGGEGETTAMVKITADTSVSVSFEAIPEVAILTLSEKKLTIKVKAKTSDGKPIEVKIKQNTERKQKNKKKKWRRKEKKTKNKHRK